MQEHDIQFPLTNSEFLRVISNSFKAFIEVGTSRSTHKLKPLHGAIAQDMLQLFSKDAEYSVIAQGVGEGKEGLISGRYFDKKADIIIREAGKDVCGISVKFIMQSYSSNANNYFENMLGETANVRGANNRYFQIFIIIDNIPHYKQSNIIDRWETFTANNAQKYKVLSRDNVEIFTHTPNKTLLYVVHIPREDCMTDKESYRKYFDTHDIEVTCAEVSDRDEYGSAVIVNDYEKFREKIYYTVKSL